MFGTGPPTPLPKRFVVLVAQTKGQGMQIVQEKFHERELQLALVGDASSLPIERKRAFQIALQVERQCWRAVPVIFMLHKEKKDEYREFVFWMLKIALYFLRRNPKRRVIILNKFGEWEEDLPHFLARVHNRIIGMNPIDLPEFISIAEYERMCSDAVERPATFFEVLSGWTSKFWGRSRNGVGRRGLKQAC